MTCEELERKWEAYAAGECEPDEREQIERHLEQCPRCQRKLDEELLRQQPSHRQTNAADAAAGTFRAQESRWMTIAKWKHRFWTAASVLAMIVVVTVVCTMLTSAYFGIGGKSSRMELAPAVITTATEMTMPNVDVRSGGTNVRPFFSMKFNYELVSRVGRRDQPVGELQGSMLFDMLSVKRQWIGGSYESRLYFVHPAYFDKLDVSSQNNILAAKDEVWNALRLLPEGTVSELAVSLDRIGPVDRLYELLADYDIDLVWYAMDTGQEALEPVQYLSAGHGLWGIGEYQTLDFIGGSMQVRGEGEKREMAFERALAFLLEHRRWVERYVHKPMLQERYDYVREHGARAYGAVLTGPTKELLKLQDEQAIRSVALGQVEWWNWYSSTFSGTIRG